jgi:hypothetical protein
MKCTSKQCGGRLKVTHTYGTDLGFTQRRVCDRCGRVVTVKATIVADDPVHGEGAATLAQRIKEAGERPRP